MPTALLPWREILITDLLRRPVKAGTTHSLDNTNKYTGWSYKKSATSLNRI